MGFGYRKINVQDVDLFQEIMYSSSISMYKLCGVTQRDIKIKFENYFSKENKLKILSNIKNLMPQEYLFIFSFNNKDIGVGYLETSSDENIIHAIYLKKEFQGKGFGTLIFEKLLSLRDMSKPTILHVLSSNIKAISLYKKFNFYETNIELPKDNLRSRDGVYLQDIEMRLDIKNQH